VAQNPHCVESAASGGVVHTSSMSVTAIMQIHRHHVIEGAVNFASEPVSVHKHCMFEIPLAQKFLRPAHSFGLGDNAIHRNGRLESLN